MIHAVRFYVVSPEKDPAFQAMLGEGGLYRELTRHLQHGLIEINLLRSQILESAYLSTEFWVTEDAYLAAQDATEQSVLTRLLKNMTISCLDLGPFAFPPRVDTEENWTDISTIAVAHCIKSRGREDA